MIRLESSARHYLASSMIAEAADDQVLLTQRVRVRSSGTVMVSATSEWSGLPVSAITRETKAGKILGFLSTLAQS